MFNISLHLDFSNSNVIVFCRIASSRLSKKRFRYRRWNCSVVSDVLLLAVMIKGGLG